jgi:hypothetical protein
MISGKISPVFFFLFKCVGHRPPDFSVVLLNVTTMEKPRWFLNSYYSRGIYPFTHKERLLIKKIRLALLKTLTNSKAGSQSHIRISVPAFLSLISRFLPCKCQSPLPEQFFGSQAAFVTTFSIPRRLSES